jgi:tRNA nucleotidyltransferase (CCA-adding enzyme)
MFKFKRFLLEQEKIDWNNFVSKNPSLKTALKIINKIASKGFKAYIVGGAVRDIISGEKQPDDIDIATNMPIEDVEKLYPSHDIGKNKTFGIVVVTVDGEDFEIANFRKDGTYTDGRRPDTVEIVMDYKDDASRRDFTINAIAKRGYHLIDPFKGQESTPTNQILKE